MEPDKSREGLYLALLAAALAVGLAVVSWYEIRHNTTDGLLETFLAVADHMEAVVVFAAATIYIGVEGGSMLAERYLRRRYREGREDGREEGLEEGRKEAWDGVDGVARAVAGRPESRRAVRRVAAENGGRRWLT